MKSISLVLIIGVLAFVNVSESAVAADAGVVLKAASNAELQAKALVDFKKAAKSGLLASDKIIAGYVKTSTENQKKSKKDWNDALDKLIADQKKASEPVKKLLSAATGENALYADAALTAINRYFGMLSESADTVKEVFTKQFTDYAAVVALFSSFNTFDVDLITTTTTSITDLLTPNTDGKGHACLKKMIPTFVGVMKASQTDTFACIEGYMTYFAFISEFIKLKLGVLKCQVDAAIKHLPACLKQISKKTAATYASDVCYGNCLATFSGMLVNRYDANGGATFTALVTQLQTDLETFNTEYNACNRVASATTAMDTLIGEFTLCSPAP